MRKIALLFVLFLAGVAWAKDAPPASAYGVSVQVITSRNSGFNNRIIAIIDGSKYELSGMMINHIMLKPGTYQARVTRDDTHKTAFELDRSYEFLLPDGSRKAFDVIGVGEGLTGAM